MESKIRTYESDNATVTWDQKRCIHFAACVHGLPDVFDQNGRPWITPENASPDELLATVRQCPTGALHMRQPDGTNPEPTPAEASVTVDPNGALFLQGDIRIRTQEGDELLRDTRVALCRCGLSKNKPLCDGSHEGQFTDAGALREVGTTLEDAEVSAELVVTPSPNGPLLVGHTVQISGADGQKVIKPKVALCRCGHSKNKPFCDGSHREAGFTAP